MNLKVDIHISIYAAHLYDSAVLYAQVLSSRFTIGVDIFAEFWLAG